MRRAVTATNRRRVAFAAARPAAPSTSQRRGFSSGRVLAARCGISSVHRGASTVFAVAPSTQRRTHFYEKQAQDDPWFDRVRAQDVYGILAVTDERVASDATAAAAESPLPLLTAESLFSGLAALSTTLQMDVVPARLTGVAAVKEGVEGVSLQPLVFERERPDADTDRFEPLDVARLRDEVRRIAHMAGWLPDGPASSPKGCLDLSQGSAARDTLGLPAFLAARTAGLGEVDARVRARQVEVSVEGVPEALADVEALIGMLLAEDDFVVKSD